MCKSGFAAKLNMELIVEINVAGFYINMLLALGFQGETEAVLTPEEHAILSGYGESLKLGKVEILAYDLSLLQDGFDQVLDNTFTMTWTTEEVQIYFTAVWVFDMVYSREHKIKDYALASTELWTAWSEQYKLIEQGGVEIDL